MALENEEHASIENSASTTDRVSRRHILGALGMGSVAALAGCAGDDSDTPGNGSDTPGNGSDTPGGDDTETPVEHVDRTMRGFSLTNQAELNFNLAAVSNFPSNTVTNTMFVPYGTYVPGQDEFVNFLLEDVSVGDGQATLSIRDDITWHNGDAFTADSVVADLTISQLTGGALWDFVNDVRVEDETTVICETDSVNSDVFKTTLYKGPPRLAMTKPELYSQFFERLEEATTQQEISKIGADLRQYTVSAEEIIGNGLFELQDVSPEGVRLTRYEDSPWADYINFDEFLVKPFSSISGAQQAMLTDGLDVLHDNKPQESTKEQLPDYWDTVGVDAGDVISMVFNTNREPVDDPRVRKAIAHVMAYNEFPEIGGSTIKTKRWQTGLSIQQGDRWLGDELQSFTSYGGPDVGWTRTDKATALLQDAGYERQGGDWVSADDGSRLEIPLEFPSHFAIQKRVQHAAQLLSEFGIKSTAQPVPRSTVYTQVIPRRNYTTMFHFSDGYHPYVRLNGMMGTLSEQPWYPRFKQETVEVPMPVGEPGGELTEFNINDRLSTAASSNDEQEVQQATLELAWAVNQTIPFIGMWEKQAVYTINRDTFNWPSDDYERLRITQPYHVMLLEENNVTARPVQ